MDHAAAVALRDWHNGHQRTGAAVDVHELHHTWYRDALHGRTLPTSPSPPAPLGLHRRKPSLQHGARFFHRHARTHVAPLLADLADTGQTPQHLFITCADSRLVPNLITATAPGELFTVRNIGNVVAPYGQDPSMQAAIDYAVGILEVATITVCGHSHCGAVQAAASRRSAHTVALHRWLDHVRHPIRSRSADADAATLAQRNVVQQMENLCTHPAVAARVARGDLQLVGMYFDLATSQVHFLDLEHGTFRPVGAVTD
jgi:carbonic anhydrase